MLGHQRQAAEEETATFRCNPRWCLAGRPLEGEMLGRVHRQKQDVSNENRAPGWLGWYKGDEILPRYVGKIVNQYKDPYEPTSIMEGHDWFWSLLHVFFSRSQWMSRKSGAPKWCCSESYSLRIQVCPWKGIPPTILWWGWDWDHQSYSGRGLDK